MRKLKHSLFCAALAIFYAKCINTLPASDEQEKEFRKPRVLSTSDFDKIVYESASAWIVAYYDGRSEDFSGFLEIWNDLTGEIADGEDVKTGVVNCGNENFLCQNQKINYTPTIKLYEKYSKPEATGEVLVNLNNANSIKRELIYHLDKQGLRQQDGSQSFANENPTPKIPEFPSNKISKRETDLSKNGTSNLTNPAFIDKVYQEDVEFAIWYSVHREIPLGKRVLEGEKLESAINYFKFLGTYGPLSQYQTNGSQFLKTLSQKLQKNETVFAGDYRRTVNSTYLEFIPVYSSNISFRWVGCHSSEERFRGYPCALWTIFHVLTVNYASSKNENEDPAKALHMVRDYVKNFFTCLECQENFEKLVERNRMDEVKDRDEAILWLWRAHNEVNKRLANDVWNMNPLFPKIQYPSEENCPLCRENSGGWNEGEVLRYLKKKYGSEDFGAGGAKMTNGRLSLILLLTVFLMSRL